MPDYVAHTDGAVLRIYELSEQGAPPRADVVAQLFVRDGGPEATVELMHGLRGFLGSPAPEPPVKVRAVQSRRSLQALTTQPEARSARTEPHSAPSEAYSATSWRQLGRSMVRVDGGVLLGGWAVSVLAALRADGGTMNSHELIDAMGADPHTWHARHTGVAQLRRHGFIQVHGRKAGARYEYVRGLG